MSDYKIRIITEADKTALQGVSKEIGKTTEETKKLDDAQKKAGESTKGFAKEHKGLIEGFKKLGAQVPILGASLNALKNPYTALALVIGIVVVKLREFMEAVEEAATRAQGLDRFNGIVRNFNTLAADQRSKKNALAEQLEDIATKAKTAEERLSELTTQIERTLKLEGDEDAAKKANELAAIEVRLLKSPITDAQKKKGEKDASAALSLSLRAIGEAEDRAFRGNGDMTPEKAESLRKVAREKYTSTIKSLNEKPLTEQQAIVERAKIEEKYSKRSLERESRRASGIVTATGNAKRLAEERAAELNAKLPGLSADEKAAQDKFDRAQRQEEQTAATGVMINGKMVPIADAYKLRNELKQQYDNGGGTMGYSGERGESLRAGMKDKIGVIESSINQHLSTLDLQRAATRDAKSELDIASGRRSSVVQELGTVVASANTLGTQFKNQSAGFNEENESGKRVSAIESSTRSMTTAADSMKAAAEAAKVAAAALDQALKSLGKDVKDQNIRLRSDAAAGK